MLLTPVTPGEKLMHTSKADNGREISILHIDDSYGSHPDYSPVFMGNFAYLDQSLDKNLTSEPTEREQTSREQHTEEVS